MNLTAIFLTGLLTGGLTCLAVQGGLLAATLAEREQEKLEDKAKNSGKALPILSFLGAKLIAYTLFGFLLGWLGSVFQLSPVMSGVVQILVAIFMIGTALNLLNIHPVFRYFVIQPPRFLTRIVRSQAKSGDLFAPALLGALTIFIPCGTTQAMMALAIASGNSLSGALIMFAFVLGTSPIFFVLGYLATRLGEALHQKFLRVAAAVIVLLAIFNLNNGLALTGTNFAVEAAWRNVFCTIAFCTKNSDLLHDVASEATINIGSGGYSPNQITVRASSAVTLKLVNNGGGGCAAAFTVPSLGIRKIVPVGSVQTIVFTAPAVTGPLPFMCSMGMYRGIINVI